MTANRTHLRGLCPHFLFGGSRTGAASRVFGNILYTIFFNCKIVYNILPQISQKYIIFSVQKRLQCQFKCVILYPWLGRPTTIQAAAVKRTKGKTMENFDYMKAVDIIDRMIGSWCEQNLYSAKLPLSNRINADNNFTMLRKKLISIAETYGIDFLTDLDYRMKYVFEERAK